MKSISKTKVTITIFLSHLFVVYHLFSITENCYWRDSQRVVFFSLLIHILCVFLIIIHGPILRVSFYIHGKGSSSQIARAKNPK